MWKYASFRSIVTNPPPPWTSSLNFPLGKGSDAADPEWVSGRRPFLEQGSSGWRTLVRCPTEVFSLSLLSVGGRKVPVVAQKPSRHCLLLSAELRRSGGDSSQTEVCSRTKLCAEPKAIPLVGAPIREWNAIEEVSCWGSHTWVGVSRRPGRSDALHHGGKPPALFGMMESEALDWKMASMGSVRCRREPIVSPNMWSAGGKRTDCRGGKPNASPNCQTEEKWWWTLSVHQTSRGGCDQIWERRACLRPTDTLLRSSLAS